MVARGFSAGHSGTLRRVWMENSSTGAPKSEARRYKDIKAVTRDTIAFLTWSIPVRNVEGKSMGPADIRLFRIDRAEIKRDRKSPRYRFYVEIDMANPTPASVRKQAWFSGATENRIRSDVWVRIRVSVYGRS